MGRLTPTPTCISMSTCPQRKLVQEQLLGELLPPKVVVVYGTVRAMPSVLHGEQGVGGRVRGNVPKLATTTNCHQKLSSKIVIRNCHQKLSSKIVMKNCHQKLSSEIVIRNCHQKLSSEMWLITSTAS